MQNNVFVNSQSMPTGSAPGQPMRDSIHYVCRILTAFAWVAILVWVFGPKGSGWTNAAGDAGLAWLIFTGGGYFAEQTVRSIVKPSGRGKTE